jgi:UDP-glucose 4-epimerase
MKYTKYLITGGAGAIGSSIANDLSANDKNKVDVIDNYESGFIGTLVKRDNVRVFVADITDKEFLQTFVEDDYDYIFHLAASFANQKSIDYPIKDQKVNSEGTLRMLEFAKRQKNLKKFVYFSSSCIYGNLKKTKMSEDDSPNPELPYAISKLSGEYYSTFFYEYYGVPVNILRIFNIYGSNEYSGPYRNVIPNFVYKALKNEDITITGDGKDTRDFTYVDDALELIYGVARDTKNAGEIYNIGSGKETRIIDVAKSILVATRSGSKIVYVPRRNWDAVYRRVADVHKVSKYKRRDDTKFEVGLKRVVDFISNS